MSATGLVTAPMDVQSAFAADMRRVKALEWRMERLGERYLRTRSAAERDRIESDQDVVNERLHLILRRYSVRYDRSFFTVSDAAGNVQRFEAAS